MPLLRHAILLLALAGSLLPAARADDALHWLQRMQQAAVSQSFQGSFIYERSGSFSTHRLWRRIDEQGAVVERLLQTDGQTHEQVRRNGQLLCSSARSQPPLTLPGAEQPSLDLLNDWYAVQVLGTTRVAARPATVLGLKPRDAFRYAHELYLDNRTGLVLKALMINERNHLLERLQFVELVDMPPSAEQVRGSAGCLAAQAEGQADTAFDPDWLPDWLPAGYQLVSLQRRPQGDGWLEVAVYSDGLARFSLFVEPAQQTLAADLQAQVGPTLALSRVLGGQAGDTLLVTLVGEIPGLAAERILAAVQMDHGERP